MRRAGVARPNREDRNFGYRFGHGETETLPSLVLVGGRGEEPASTIGRNGGNIRSAPGYNQASCRGGCRLRIAGKSFIRSDRDIGFRNSFYSWNNHSRRFDLLPLHPWPFFIPGNTRARWGTNQINTRTRFANLWRPRSSSSKAIWACLPLGPVIQHSHDRMCQELFDRRLSFARGQAGRLFSLDAQRWNDRCRPANSRPNETGFCIYRPPSFLGHRLRLHIAADPFLPAVGADTASQSARELYEARRKMRLDAWRECPKEEVIVRALRE